MSAGENDARCVKNFRGWLTHFTGCPFANAIAREAMVTFMVAYLPLVSDDVAMIDAFFDEAAERRHVGAAIFPDARTHADVVAILSTLSAEARWSCRNVPWGAHAREYDVQLGLQWRTSAGRTSSIMGFAPFGTMPISRRAPYVALVGWGGGYENDERRSPEGTVGVIDAALPPNVDHGKTWKSTFPSVRELLRDAPEDTKVLRDVAFCVPREAVAGQFAS